MKKIFKISGIAIFSIVILYGIKYFYDLSFQGNQKIKIIKDYEHLCSIKELIEISEFKNKVLYIDIWGVFCKPCIEEFNYIPELKNIFKDKPVVFIYLASPYAKFNDTQKWKAALKKYKLNGYNALMSIEFYNEIWKEIPEMKSPYFIPHYLLIDKNGNIVDPNAPRRSEKEELVETINKFL